MSFGFDLDTKRRLYDKLSDRSESSSDKGWYSAICVYICSAASYIRQDINIASRVLRAFNETLNQLFTHYDTEYKNKYGRHLIVRFDIRGDRITMICSTPQKVDHDYIFNIACHIYSFNLMFQKKLKKRGLKTFDISVGLATSNGTPGLYSRAFVDAIHLAKYGIGSNLRTFITNYTFYYNLNDNNKKLFSVANDYTGEKIYHCNCWFPNEKKWVEDNF